MNYGGKHSGYARAFGGVFESWRCQLALFCVLELTQQQNWIILFSDIL